jgi:hypothetical protein
VALPVKSHQVAHDFWLTELREEGTKLGEGEGSKLGEPCPKVRLSQDR